MTRRCAGAKIAVFDDTCHQEVGGSQMCQSYDDVIFEQSLKDAKCWNVFRMKSYFDIVSVGTIPRLIIIFFNIIFYVSHFAEFSQYQS